MEEKADVLVAMRVAAILGGGGEGRYSLVLQEIVGQRRIVMTIGQAEAQAIAVFMEGVTMPRPLTHELMVRLVEGLGGKVSRVIIEGLDGGRFLTQIVCKRLEGDVPLVVDARTSDAVALAIRSGAPIFARESLLEMLAGKVAEHKERSVREMGDEELKALREKAVEAEEYERAQEIQDELKRRGEA